MVKVFINGVEFDNVSNMTTIMNKYPIDGEHFIIDIPSINILNKIKQFSLLFKEDIFIPIPLYLNMEDIVPNDLVMWLSLLTDDELQELYRSSITLGYQNLNNILSLYLASQSL